MIRKLKILFKKKTIGSIAPLGAVFGSLSAGPLLHFYGRKFTLLLASPLWTLGWISIATAVDWKLIIAGRILSGFCVGLCLPSAQIYVSAKHAIIIASNEIRILGWALKDFDFNHRIILVFLLQYR